MAPSSPLQDAPELLMVHLKDGATCGGLNELAIKSKPWYVHPPSGLQNRDQLELWRRWQEYEAVLRPQQQQLWQQANQWPQHPHHQLPVDVPARPELARDPLQQPKMLAPLQPPAPPATWLKGGPLEPAKTEVPPPPSPPCSKKAGFRGGGACGPGGHPSPASSGAAMDPSHGEARVVEPPPAKAPLAGCNSAGHDQGQCKPCLFMYRGICNRKFDCQYCHLPHTTSQIRRVHPSKITRRCLRWRMQENTLEDQEPAETPDSEAPLKEMADSANCSYFGLSAVASEKELDNAYRQHAKKMHPDKNGGTDEAKQRFQGMKERYEKLKARRNGGGGGQGGGEGSGASGDEDSEPTTAVASSAEDSAAECPLNAGNDWAFVQLWQL